MIRSFEQITDKELGDCGGKGASLVKMVRMGLPVPEGWVVFPGTGKDEVNTFASGIDRTVTYAVRSSALNEDGAEASFAGAYETVTDVKREGIGEAFAKVVSSADSDRVSKYADAVSTQNIKSGEINLSPQ